MAATRVQQTVGPFEPHDSDSDQVASERNEDDALLGPDVLDEAGTFGLHLGVIRRLAMLGRGELPDVIRPRAARPGKDG